MRCKMACVCVLAYSFPNNTSFHHGLPHKARCSVVIHHVGKARFKPQKQTGKNLSSQNCKRDKTIETCAKLPRSLIKHPSGYFALLHWICIKPRASHDAMPSESSLDGRTSSESFFVPFRQGNVQAKSFVTLSTGVGIVT